ncbi:ADP-heptose:LPS heptosyltransferase [Bosea sp. OK403]|uniref:glycosyltransferase family 9 protein n=1 Tax=Bosea sp. OK403 TaxID=1855286 RepID=UPI0008E18CC1|nr:glycosyltransferase family 9 protein [Bosea sp. OK403]SFJ54949.1 ADP-heptose:LPS heptosyltransferase [Bosea sp. OK403]
MISRRSKFSSILGSTLIFAGRNSQGKADTARDAGDWRRAAFFYARAADEQPKRAASFWVQAGNCAKESHQFAKALEFYSYAEQALHLTPEAHRSEAWRNERADLFVQFGHLLKLSGNFSACANAYRGAAEMGSPDGPRELQALGHLNAAVVKFSQATEGDVSAVSLLAVCSCELRPLDAETLREAARALSERPANNDLACSFAGLAYLSDRSAHAVKNHLDFVARYGLRGVVASTAAGPGKERAPNARKLVRNAALQLANETANEISVAFEPQHGAVQQLSLNQGLLSNEAEKEALARALTLSIEAVFATAWAHPDDFSLRLNVAFDRMEAASKPLDSLVVFCETRTAKALRAVAIRALNNAVQAWLATHKLGAGMAALDRLAVGVRFEYGDALRRRRTELGSGLKLFSEIDSLLYGATKDPGGRDRATAVLLAAISDSLTLEEAVDLLQIDTFGPISVKAAIAVAHQNACTPHESIYLAQKLKEHGRLAESLMILDAFDEKYAPMPLLIEKALISKSLGKFRVAAELLESCYRTEPTEFVRNELAMLLPEVESIPSILHRYAGDAAFFQLAHRHAAFNIASMQHHRATQDAGSAPLVPELIPKVADQRSYELAIEVLGLGGGTQETQYGRLRVLRPVDFARVRTSSRIGYETMRVRLNGRTIAECAGSALTQGFEQSPYVHQIFNAWFEVGPLQPGPHSLQLHFQESNGGYAGHDLTVWVDERDWKRLSLTSSAIVLPSPSDDMIETRIASLPSQRFDADRTYFDGELSRILVVRADQLGDTVLSFPAVAALRRHFPASRVDALVSPGQFELARGSGLFDAVFSVAFPYNQATRHRVLSVQDQHQLGEMLSGRNYDLAIDLAPGSLTRPLLKLAKARYTAGFKPDEFPWLDIAFDLRVRDAGNRHEAVSHARAPEALIAAIAVAALGRATQLPKTPLDSHFREQLGLKAGQRYAVFHSGARTLSRKWPLDRYLEVARRTIQAHHIPVVLLLDDPSELPEKPADLSHDLIVLRGHPTFAQFDGLLSNCAVFLGNDSGPKHLAALRGAPVVSIHMGAVNWREWGQDGIGVVVTRDTPCYGCGIELAEECGKGLPCLTDIRPAEVANAITDLLSKHPSALRESQ